MSLRLIQRFGRSLTVTRKTPGSYVEGDFVPGNTSTFSIIGCPQPLTGDEQNFVNSGSDDSERIKLYSTSLLQKQNSVGNQVIQADVLSVDGKDFQVVIVERHVYPGATTIQFYKYILEAL